MHTLRRQPDRVGTGRNSHSCGIENDDGMRKPGMQVIVDRDGYVNARTARDILAVRCVGFAAQVTLPVGYVHELDRWDIVAVRFVSP